MLSTERDLLLDKITGFLSNIGIPNRPGVVSNETFLPGVDIVEGSIIYDAERLLSPGDLLHEAGHIAVLLKNDRETVTSPDVSGDLQPPGAEMAAIAWSWAALIHLNIPPHVVFHPEGYKGDADHLIECFENKRYVGVSLLQWFGMTTEPRRGMESSNATYPGMINWLRVSPAAG